MSTICVLNRCNPGARYWRLSVSSSSVCAGCGVWWRAGEVTCLKSRCAGYQPAARDDRAAPECPPEPAFCVCVADQLSVHDVGQAAFQAAHGFVATLAVGSFPQVVGPSGGIVADLGEGHDVQAEGELAIAGAGKAV